MSNSNSSILIGDNYREIAEKLIVKYPKAFEHIDVNKILFLVDQKKSPKKFADVRKVGHPFDFFTEHKFIMTFYENNMAPLGVAQVNMVVLHELLHISYDFDKLVKHDVQDFSAIVDKYNSNWTMQQDLPDILADEVIFGNDNLGRDDEDIDANY